MDALTRTDFLGEVLEDTKNAAPDDNDNNHNNDNNDHNHEADAEAVVKRRKKNKKSGRGSMKYYRTLDNGVKLLQFFRMFSKTFPHDLRHVSLPKRICFEM